MAKQNEVKVTSINVNAESKSAQKLADAIIFREMPIADRAAMHGILKATEKYDDLKKEYKRALNLIQVNCKDDMEIDGKFAVSINYHSITKCKVRKSAAIKELSTLEKAVNIIRRTRTIALLKSLTEMIPSNLSGMSDDVWEKVALQTGNVPSRHRQATETGAEVINKESAKLFRLEHNLSCKDTDNVTTEKVA